MRINTGAKFNRNNYYSIITTITQIIVVAWFIPLSNIMGNKGIGILAISLELYTIISILFSNSISASLGRIIASRVKKNQYYNASRAFRTVLIYSLIVGGLFTIANILLSDFITGSLMNLPFITLCFRVIFIGLFINMINGTLKGYLMTNARASIPIFADVVWAITSITSGTLITLAMKNYGDKVAALLKNSIYSYSYAAVGPLIGIAIGSIMVLVFLLMVLIVNRYSYIKAIKSDTTRYYEPSAQIIRLFLSGMPILIFSDLLINSIQFIGIIIANLINNNHTVEVADIIESIGSYYGKAFVFVRIMVALAGYVSFSFYSIYKQDNVNYNNKLLTRDAAFNHINNSFILFGIISATIFSSADVIIKALYKYADPVSVNYLKLVAPMILTFTFIIIIEGIFKIMYEDVSLVIFKIVAIIIYIILCIALSLTLKQGYISIIISQLSYSLVLISMYCILLRNKLNLNKSHVIILLKSIVCFILTGGVQALMAFILKDTNIYSSIPIVVVLIIMITGYFFGLLFLSILRCIDFKVIVRIPFGGLFSMLYKNQR